MTKTFDMFDMTTMEYTRFYENNRHFFWESKNWFYFKNDKKTSARSGFVCYGTSNGYSYKDDTPKDSHGAAVLLCTTSDISNLRTKCEKTKDVLVRFKLKDGKSDAYVSIFKKDGKEVGIGLVIKHNPQTMDFPFSKKGATTYAEASKEEGTLPWMVENDKFVEMIPDEILELIGIKTKNQSSKQEKIQKDLLELNEIDKEMAALTQRLEELKTKRDDLIVKKILPLDYKSK